MRFETPPGHQLQIDFGERLIEIAGEKIKAFVFVATLGYNRRTSSQSQAHGAERGGFVVAIARDVKARQGTHRNRRAVQSLKCPRGRRGEKAPRDARALPRVRCPESSD